MSNKEDQNEICFFVSYKTSSGESFRINTTHDLDTFDGLARWVAEEEKIREGSVIPVFWRRLSR